MIKKTAITACVLGSLLISPALHAAASGSMTDHEITSEPDETEDIMVTLVNIVPVSDKEGYLDFKSDDGTVYRSESTVDLSGVKAGATVSAKRYFKGYKVYIETLCDFGGSFTVIICVPIVEL